MIEDANMQPKDRLGYDVCVVGSGAAGITHALGLSAKGMKVLLIEGGSSAFSKNSQQRYKGRVVNEEMHSPPDKYRRRALGGSTTIWGGRCVPFDPIDFSVRQNLCLEGWPISYEEVAQYYPEATRILEAGVTGYDADLIGERMPEIVEGFISARVKTNGLERFSAPTNFGQRYFNRMSAADSLCLLLNANCVEIVLHEGGQQGVKFLRCKNGEGKEFRVFSRHFVMAMGGIENARILLSSRGDGYSAGVGNSNDLVGRFYMCHMAGNIGKLAIKSPLQKVWHNYWYTKDGVYVRRRFSLSEDVQRSLGIANVVSRLHFSNIADPAHRSGILSGLYLVKGLISYEYGKRLKDASGSGLRTYMRHVVNILSTPVETLDFLFNWLRRRTFSIRKFPSVILNNRTNVFSLDVHGEQLPRFDSRITVGDDVDDLGVPRVIIDWKYSDADINSIREYLRVMAKEFRDSGVGSLEFNEDDVEVEMTKYGAYGGHHIGTTRMSDSSKGGVVDKDLFVFGVPNLSILGSSVFPTSSQANPTLTIVALALRHTEFLVRVLKGK
jgi:choline dehydrogenase-like flavoprotein